MNRHRLLQPTVSFVFIILSIIACGAPAATPSPIPAPPTHTPVPPTPTPVPTLAPKPTATAIPKTGQVTGRAYVFDTDQPATTTVLLFDASSGDMNTILYDQPVNRTVTDAEGRYSFAVVQPGTYIVAVTGKGQEVSFCGNTPGLLEAGTLDGGTWVITYMKIEEKFTVSAGSVLQQDIVIKCN